MSDDTEEQKVCQTCSDFEPQTWRKSLCKNCFHSLEEHSPELLAHEAQVVAKEKAAIKSTDANKEQTVEPPSSGKSSNQIATDDKSKEPNAETTQEKGDGAQKVRRKYGAERVAAEGGGGAWSWAIDLGRGYSKSDKPPITETSKSASVPSATAAPSSSSIKSATQPPSKPSAKSTQADEQASTPSSTDTTSDTTTVSISKAKNVASKFESKAQTLPKAKPTTRPPEIRPGSASVAAFAGKLTDNTSSTKTQPKTTEPQKLVSSKTDSKDTKSVEAASTFPRTVSTAAKDSTADTKKNIKPTPQAGKLDDKSSGLLTAGQLKSSPFGKDMLKSVKDSGKREISSPSHFEKTESVGKRDKADSPSEKPDSSTESVDEERKSSSANSLEKSESLPIKSAGENKHSSAISLESKSQLSEIKVGDTSKGKEPVKSVPSIELATLVPETASLSPGSKSGFEKVTNEGRSVTDVETVVPGVKLSEVGQRGPRDETGLAENCGYLAPVSEHVVESIVRQSGHLANSTGSGSGAKTGEDSGIKERVLGAVSTDDVTVQGQDSGEDASRTLPECNIPDLAPDISQEPETNEVAQEKLACQNATSISSSPSEIKSTAAATLTPESTTASSNSHSAQSVSNSATPPSDVGILEHLQLDEPKDYNSGQLSDSRKPDFTSEDNEDSQLSVTPSTSLPLTEREQKDETPSNNAKENEEKAAVNEDIDRLSRELNEKDRELSILAKQLSSMEEQMRVMEEERDQYKRTSAQTQKEDLEALLDELRSQLAKMEKQCSRLESDNQSLIDKLRVQEAKVKHDQECRGRTSDNTVLEEDLEAAEKELEEVKDENKELQSHIMEMKNEMDEMYDHFRENEHDEFRELEKELDLTAKNCRILQFKLRKAERRNEQVEQDRLVYEEKLRVLQDQFDSQDAKNHIRLLEDELRMAKEVSVRLHDELDLLEDKRNKAMEESRHLTELLEHTDKRQFRMEMEIDKLRDVVSELKQQLKEARSGNNKESTPDRKPPLGLVGKQGSREYDVSQLMKDLYDSMERENDLKDQLKFTEEEAKMMRRRVSEMDEENENLRLQLQKMSEKASKHKKKEKERMKELEVERRHSESYKTALSAQSSQDEDKEDMSSDVILIVGPEGGDSINGDDLVRVSQRKDSTDEDLMNVLQMRVQLEMLEHELMSSHQKLDEMDLENENMQAEIKFLQERLAEKETSGNLPEPSTPNAYYEDKLKEMSQEADELRWKLIEKDRELERLSVVQTRHGRDHGHKKDEKLKKSKSLEEADVMQADLRKLLEQAHADISRLKKAVDELTGRNKELAEENEEFKNKTPIPSVLADDAAVENIELKENLRKMEETGRAQVEKIKTLTENLQKLARDNRSFVSIATSPTVPGTLSIPGIPLVGPGTQTARAGLELPNPGDDSSTRDLHTQLHVLERENEELRGLMAAQVATCTWSTGTTLPGSAPQHKPESSQPVLSKSQTKTREHGKKIASKTNDLATSESKLDSVKTSLNVDRNDLTDRTSEPVELASSSTVMDCKIPSTDPVPDAERTSQDVDGENKSEDAGEKAVEKEKSLRGKESSKEEPVKSILLEYPEGKSKVVISGTESRVELMEKVLEMDEEIGDLLSMMRKREDECDRMKREMKYLNSQLKQMKDESRRTELDLLQELDMLHDKNSVMSNLLDIINERAEAAEEELERRIQEDPTHSPARSASNVSQVSALSDTSVGSDEVFLTAFVSKEGVITRDWESKLKVRIESLERLLAEERQKVSTAEKKLLLAGIDSVSPSVSDDVKLRIREKELLQEELLKSQRHLHIATDQINGLKARVHLLEDEHARLKADYARLYDEMDKNVDKPDGSDQNASDSEKASEEKSDEVPFVAKRISVVEAPKFRDLRRATDDTDGANEKISKLEEELQRYKQIAKELEYKVEEIDDIWRSKSSASEKERDELDKQVKEKVMEINLLEKDIENLKVELSAKDKIVTSKDAALVQKNHEIARLTELVETREGDKKKIEQERENLAGQITQRDSTIKGLNDTLRIRDERLKEKDDMLFKLNTSIEQNKRDMNGLTDKIKTMSGPPSEQAAKSVVLHSDVSSSSGVGRDIPRDCQTDLEKESFRLKETVKKLQVELDKVVGDKRALESNLEKSRKSLDEAMLMWNKDRNSLQRDANILEEKVRMYEAFNSMNKDETIETLKNESQGYFTEREALVCELSMLKLKHETSERVYKEQVAKLQAELTEKLRLLKTEVDSNSHISTEMNRLKRQAEMAYRLQQDQRVFKAENLAMKVRYETRIDKLSKEHNKMLLTIDKLQKERDMDKQIIDSIQKNLNLVKDSYTEELVHSQDNKGALRKYVKEIEELRLHLDELQRHTRDLRDKTIDQERLRTDMINKFATDRSSWEIEKANLNSQINQLEEKIYSSSRQQERSKDIQVNMGMAWEKERREQQRLLSEAHTLALDLQDQLRSRDEAFAHDRKDLLRQIENERVAWTKEKRVAEQEAMEMTAVLRKLTTMEKRLKDMQENAQKEKETWRKEKADILSLAAEEKHVHARDTRKVEHVLGRLIRLRELGIMLTSQPKWDSLEEKPPDRQENTDQSIIDYVKEVVVQVCQVVDDLILLTNPSSDEEAIKRISSSEIDLLKQQFSRLHHESDNSVVVADISTSSVVTKSRVEEKSAGISRRLPDDAILSVGPGLPHSTAFSEAITKSSNRSVLSSSSSRQEPPPSILIPTTTQSSTVVMRHGDASSRHNYRPPSYASGTRSAQTSRATTPEVLDPALDSSYASTSRKPGSTEPALSYSIPRYNIFQTQKQKFASLPSASADSSSSDRNQPRRPITFMKSLSMDSASILDSPPDSRGAHQLTSMSASNTPTQPATSADMASLFSAPSVITSTSDHHLTVSRNSSSRDSSSRDSSEKVSPRTARRMFFESYPSSTSTFPASLGYQSWPERCSTTPTLHVRQTSLPDPEEVRREAEEEHDIVSSKLETRGRYSVMKSSTSWDEQMHRRDVTPDGTSPSASTSHDTLAEGISQSSTEEHQQGSKHSTAKEKRRLFKKASSLDSTVGSTIAKVGVAIMNPGAPTGFAPSELFAAVKGKFKPVFKKKSAVTGSTPNQPRSPSPLFIQTDVSDVHFAGHGATSLPVPVPPVDVSSLPACDQPDQDEFVSDIQDDRSRNSLRNDVPRGKWRSKSADRVQAPLNIRADVVRTAPGVWQFNETAV